MFKDKHSYPNANSIEDTKSFIMEKDKNILGVWALFFI